MGKKFDEKALQAIVHILEQSRESLSIHEILKQLPSTTVLRTLQYQLSFLATSGQIETLGTARARKYRSIAKTPQVVSEELIPLSKAAKEIQLQLQRPVQSRTPVGYNRPFLDAYRPNTSFYLPEALRKKLYALGKSNGERPAGTYAREIFNRLLVDLSWNSSRLEGNTYSLLETEQLIQDGALIAGKDAKETQMILNHKAAIEFLVESAADTKIDRYTILNLHALLSNNLLPNPASCGRLRSIPVAIAKTVYHPLAVPQLIQECFQQIIDTAAAILDPFEQAFFLMVQLPYLQPFEDVNKRVSRLSCNIPLIRENLCPLSFIDVPEELYISGCLGVYELNRIELLRDVFEWAYERSAKLYQVTRQTLGEPDHFRMRYRHEIQICIQKIVLNCLDKQHSVAFIRNYLSEIPQEDQLQFSTTVETELKNLHEGNIARFKIKLSDYRKFAENWK